MEPHLVSVILNHYILTFELIFFIQQLNTGLKNCKNDLPLLLHFKKQFILEDLSIILEFNDFYINGISIHLIKGTEMETKFAVVGSNLV